MTLIFLAASKPVEDDRELGLLGRLLGGGRRRRRRPAAMTTPPAAGSILYFSFR